MAYLNSITILETKYMREIFLAPSGRRRREFKGTEGRIHLKAARRISLFTHVNIPCFRLIYSVWVRYLCIFVRLAAMAICLGRGAGRSEDHEGEGGFSYQANVGGRVYVLTPDSCYSCPCALFSHQLLKMKKKTKEKNKPLCNDMTK